MPASTRLKRNAAKADAAALTTSAAISVPTASAAITGGFGSRKGSDSRSPMSPLNGNTTSAPSATPIAPPASDRSVASLNSMRESIPRDAPTTRSTANSRRLSLIIMANATTRMKSASAQMAPTSAATVLATPDRLSATPLNMLRAASAFTRRTWMFTFAATLAAS